jgi:hypothetical protein
MGRARIRLVMTITMALDGADSFVCLVLVFCWFLFAFAWFRGFVFEWVGLGWFRGCVGNAKHVHSSEIERVCEYGTGVCVES